MRRHVSEIVDQMAAEITAYAGKGTAEEARELAGKLFDLAYDSGYESGESSGYADWIIALDGLPFEVEKPQDVIDGFAAGQWVG